MTALALAKVLCAQHTSDCVAAWADVERIWRSTPLDERKRWRAKARYALKLLAMKGMRR